MNVEQFLSKHLRVHGQEGDELRCFCPFHQDEKPSFSVKISTGAWRCFSQCGGGRSLRSLAKKLGVELPPDIITGVIAPKHVEPRYVPKGEIDAAALALQAAEGPLGYLHKRGITSEAITKLLVGFHPSSNRIWLPWFDSEGRCVNVKCYDWTKLQPSKFLNYGKVSEGYGGNRLWPQGVVEKHSEVFLFAGEPDCLLAHSLGIENAVTTTGGEGSWDDSFTRALAGKKVFIIYDIDAAGVAGANRVAQALGVASKVSILSLPISEPKNGDFTDYVRQHAVDYRKFMEWVAGYRTTLSERIGLGATITPASFGKSVSIRSTVAGKDNTPYMVPKRICVSCRPDDANKVCGGCPLRAFGGVVEKDLEDGSEPMLGAVFSSQWMMEAGLDAYLDIPKRCPGHKIQVTKSVPVWDVRLTNDLDSEEGREDGEFVARRAYTQCDLQANAPYDLSAIATADPKTQKALLYVTEASSSQTGLDTFTTEGKEELLKLWEVQ